MALARAALPFAILLTVLVRGQAASVHPLDRFYVEAEGVCGAQCIEKLLQSDALAEETCDAHHLGTTEQDEMSWVRITCVSGNVKMRALKDSLHGLEVSHPLPDGNVAAIKVTSITPDPTNRQFVQQLQF